MELYNINFIFSFDEFNIIFQYPSPYAYKNVLSIYELGTGFRISNLKMTSFRQSVS